MASNTVSAVEEGVYAAKRALNRGVENAADLRDTAVYRVKKNPLTALGLAFGVGMLLGAAIGWLGRRQRE